MTARIVWRPAAADIDNARVTAFAREASARAARDLRSYADLHRWAVENPRQFWSLWADESGIEWIHQGESVLRDEDDFPRARFFSDSTLNYAQNLLLGDDEEIAIVAVDESGERQTRTFAQLRGEVAAVADFLGALGIGKGDRVAGVLPNRIEAVAAMLATAARGAVWSGCSPDFGPAAIADRFSQIAPKVLFVADSCRYGGKVFDLREKLRAALTRIDSEGGAIKNLIVIESDPGARRAAWRDFFSARRVDFYAEAVAAEVAPRYAACGFNDPLWILYSSGTTGKPKCVTHGVGGPLLEHLKEHLLHVDLRRGERILYYTTCGWMMWNWLVSALAARATIVLFDGDPFLPHCESLWDVAAREKIAVAGVSAKYLCALEKAGGEIARGRDLTSLRAVLSTGSPLSAPSYDYFYRVAPPRARLQSISGGTDIVGCFALGHPCCRFVAARFNAFRWAWMSRCSTTAGGREAAAKASWCVGDRCPASRSVFGAMREGASFGRHIFRVSRAFGRTAITPRCGRGRSLRQPASGSNTKARSFTGARMRRSIRAVCASARRKSTASSNRCRRFWRRWRSGKKSTTTTTSGFCCLCVWRRGRN